MFKLANNYYGYYVLNVDRDKNLILVTDGKKLTNFEILKDNKGEYFKVGKREIRA